jgi:two-component system, OmpR family, phosphate regulon response regulator PhoB
MSASTAPASSIFSPRRVLVVDGDVDTREMYGEFFANQCWRVTQARDGRDALVLALKERPSIVVTELWLPIIDGLALCRLLRRDRLTRAIPILVVTSETRADYLRQAAQVGANAVLIKPSTPNTVSAEIDRLTSATTVHGFTLPSATRRSVSKAHLRFETSMPNDPAPELCCPICTAQLRYEKTFIGGVSRRFPERWDRLTCPSCGEFSYRHRTGKLRHIVSALSSRM